MSEQSAEKGLLERLVLAYWEPLGWDVDELDEVDLRECRRSMEPIAELATAYAEQAWDICISQGVQRGLIKARRAGELHRSNPYRVIPPEVDQP